MSFAAVQKHVRCSSARGSSRSTPGREQLVGPVSTRSSGPRDAADELEELGQRDESPIDAILAEDAGRKGGHDRQRHDKADALSLTIVADFAPHIDASGSSGRTPRKLERWWGPPTWPATFTAG